MGIDGWGWKGNDILDRLVAWESPGVQETSNKDQSWELKRMEGWCWKISLE